MGNSELLARRVSELDGYRISNTHFKIGTKIHSEDFFYAKGLFQNSYYTARIAMALAMDIIEKMRNRKVPVTAEEPLTLVGYETYSELLLSLIRKYLLDLEYKKVNHFVVSDLDDVIRRIPVESELNNNVIIIVPIASTGSTAVGIEEYLRTIKPSDALNFITEHYNIILANDTSEGFKSITDQTDGQQPFLHLSATWARPYNCPWCTTDRTSRPLFETDKSSLTPTLIFDLPSAKNEGVEGDNDGNTIDRRFAWEFDDVDFSKAIIYRRARRNNEHFLFSTNTETLIKNNRTKIDIWLDRLREKMSITSRDKIVIISPSHYSNAQFINLVNDRLFNSSATIIHYQTEVDYLSNFRLLNSRYLKQKNLKIFFVDDSLISGKTFFAIYDLFRYATDYDEKLTLTGSIFLSDKSSPDIHRRVYRASSKWVYSFVNINLPIAHKIFDKKPLEREVIRYKEVSNLALHDVLKDAFAHKALDIEGEVQEKPSGEEERHNRGSDRMAPEMEIAEEIKKGKRNERHLRMFIATHKVYEFFEKREDMSNISFDEFVDKCHLKYNRSDETERKEHAISMMKVLSQYPFLLYKPVREKTFEWHKQWLNEFVKSLWEKLKSTEGISYEEFRELKFLIRRAVFLVNQRITSADFFELLNKVMYVIDMWLVFETRYIQNTFNPVIKIYVLPEGKRKSLETFQLYLLQQYVELIHKSPWYAMNILNGINKTTFDNPRGKQFERMIRLEVAMVVTPFYNRIMKDALWPIISNARKSVPAIDKSMREILKYLITPRVRKSSAFETCDLVLKAGLNNKASVINHRILNFLWIRRFISADTSNNLGEISLTEKTEAIYEKIKELFVRGKDIGIFFVVTDGADEPHLVYDKDVENHSFFEDVNKYEVIIRFLMGVNIPNTTSYKTIVEYVKRSGETWTDIYSMKPEKVQISFMRKNEWLMLLRIGDPDLKTLGLIGVYSQQNMESDLLAKQLLMLLRDDMGSFIRKHHKNDEFSALREAEAVKRFAYLAGHGRQMMQKLAREEKSFYDVVDTMERLQYLMATKSTSTKTGNSKKKNEQTISDLLNKVFIKTSINKKTIKHIVDMGNLIYKSPIIENVVRIPELTVPDNLENLEFPFNADIFTFICFELFVNAKKNRFHFIPNEQCTCYTKVGNNILEYSVTLEEDVLILKIVNSGPPIPVEVQEKINGGVAVKENFEVSGLHLINTVLGIFAESSDIEIKGQSQCECCGLTLNTVTVTILPQISQ